MNALPHAALQRARVLDGELCVAGMRLSQLAQRVGSTPFYAYERDALRQRVEELRAVFPSEVRLHYAMKANPMPELVAYMAALVDGVDVASAGELAIALHAGANPREVSFAGPGKSEAELAQASAAGILINVESMREIPLLAETSRRTGHPARVAVRVNPDFELKSSGMRMGGGPKQFGIDAEQVPEALAHIGQQGLAFEGFHIFSGSQNLHAASICDSQNKVFELALRLAEHAPRPVRVVNLGGGFGIPYFPGEQSLNLESIAANLHALVERAKHELPQVELVIELGRYLVGEAGVYVCRVVDRKVSRGEVFLVTDGGLHQHLAASGNFGQVIRKNFPVAIGTKMDGQPREFASVVGPLCTPLDLLADRMELARANVGDLVVVFQSGAYGRSASPIDFLSHPPPLELLV
jgi:diaminopimelate decarboxylase